MDTSVESWIEKTKPIGTYDNERNVMIVKSSQAQEGEGGRHFSCPIRAIIFASRDLLNKILTVKRKVNAIHYSYNVSD